jgi:hypothetical protein
VEETLLKHSVIFPSVFHMGQKMKLRNIQTVISTHKKSSKRGIKLECFFVSSETEINSVAAGELHLVCHTVKHNLSYSTMDCANIMCPVIFNDTKIALRVQCGRTKAEMLVCNVMAPESISEVSRDLNKVDYFSVAIDASNRRNSKLWPLCVHFTAENGIECKVLDFHADPEEVTYSVVFFFFYIYKYK